MVLPSHRVYKKNLNSAISGRLYKCTSYFPLHISVGNALFLLICKLTNLKRNEMVNIYLSNVLLSVHLSLVMSCFGMMFT